MVTSKIIDGHNSGNELRINKEGAASVEVHSHPPTSEVIATVPFRQFFTDNGLPAGSNDMIVDGSSTAVDFFITASPDFDIYIKTISVEIGDGGNPNLNLFGALTALSNGIEWIHFTQQEGDYTLHDGIKTNKEFVRLGIRTGAIGTGANSYLADVSGGGSEKSYLPIIDMTDTFGMPWGLRLAKGTTDKIVFRINDAMAGLSTFNAVGYGIRF